MARGPCRPGWISTEVLLSKFGNQGDYEVMASQTSWNVAKYAEHSHGEVK